MGDIESIVVNREVQRSIDIERIMREFEAIGDLVHPHVEVSIEEKLPRWALDMIIYELKEKDRTWNVSRLRDYLEGLVRPKKNISRICSVFIKPTS